MKRPVLILLTALAALAVALPARAQYGAPSVPEDQEPEKKPYSPEESDPTAKKIEDKTCPSIAVLSDANRSTIFDGQGKDVTNIVYKAHLSDPAVSCKHKRGDQLNIDVKAVLGIELGLAATTREIEIPYFIAIVDPEEMVVTKEKGTMVVKVQRDSRTGAATLESPTIKLGLEEDTVGADLEVLVGLQLDKDQLEFNRLGH